MSTATIPEGSIAAVKEDVPLTMFGAYLARMTSKQTRKGTALRTLFALVVGAGAVVAVRWDRERQYQLGMRDGQRLGAGGDEPGDFDP